MSLSQFLACEWPHADMHSVAHLKFLASGFSMLFLACEHWLRCISRLYSGLRLPTPYVSASACIPQPAQRCRTSQPKSSLAPLIIMNIFPIYTLYHDIAKEQIRWKQGTREREEMGANSQFEDQIGDWAFHPTIRICAKHMRKALLFFVFVFQR